jgi:hypothetical protein
LQPKFNIQSVHKVVNPTTKDWTMWLYYKKTWLFKRSNLTKMFTFTKGDGCFD